MAGAAQRCTDIDIADERLFEVKSWSGLRKWFESYRQCDDGYLAEGVSDYVVVSLARHWKSLPKLKRQMEKNPEFAAFVIRHIDATTDPDDLNAIIENTTNRCPDDLAPLCSAINSAASNALTEP